MKMMKSSRKMPLLALLLLAAGCADQSSTMVRNPYADDYSHMTPLSNRDLWGTANVHDPSIIKTDSFYYVYSTDAYYTKPGVAFNETGEQMGNVPIRRSRDLVNWEFVGWALDKIPETAVAHVHTFTDNQGADNMWAPFVYKYNNKYRLYYSVSSFGTNASYIGLAESTSPEGPFTDLGEVVKTNPASTMNAIDASVIKDEKTGQVWMHYGSYFGGLHVVELDEQTGLTKTAGDLGHLVATRADKETRIIEAPEILYNSDLQLYFLFVSYDPLFTFYNVRVGRSDKAEGPFLDFFGNDLAESTNNYPILTHSYMFENHPGWSGNAHCAVLNDNGRYFMLHQGRLAPDNLMMQMHVREIKWLPSGWPVVAPQRYAGIEESSVKSSDIPGVWELIHLTDLTDQSDLWQGQIPPGGWTYDKSAFNVSVRTEFKKNGDLSSDMFKQWQMVGETIELDGNVCMLFSGWDWESERKTIMFSGLLPDGTSVWGKKVE